MNLHTQARRIQATKRVSHDRRLLDVALSLFDLDHLVHSTARLYNAVIDDPALIEALCRSYVEKIIAPRFQRDFHKDQGARSGGAKGEASASTEANVDSTPAPDLDAFSRARAFLDQPQARPETKPGPLAGVKFPKSQKAGKPRGMEAMALLPLWDTFKVRGNILIGDLTVGEARRIAETNEYEAGLLRSVLQHVGVSVNPSEPLRNLMKLKTLEEIVEKFTAEHGHA